MASDSLLCCSGGLSTLGRLVVAFDSPSPLVGVVAPVLFCGGLSSVVASVLLSSVWWRASLLWLKSRSLLWPWMVIGARWLTAGSVRCWLGWGQTICGFCATDGQEAENTPESSQEQLNISPIALPIAYRILIPIAPAIGNRWYLAIANRKKCARDSPRDSQSRRCLSDCLSRFLSRLWCKDPNSSSTPSRVDFSPFLGAPQGGL